MRSMPECAASDNMPSEPVRIPVSSLSRVTQSAAITELSAAERFSALISAPGSSGGFDAILSGVAATLMS